VGVLVDFSSWVASQEAKTRRRFPWATLGTVDTSAALYAFLFSIALETAMSAMMVAYSSPKVPIPNPPIAVPPELEVVEPRAVPRLVASNPPAVSVIEFSAGALERAPGAELEFDDFYLAYWEHCKAFDGRAVSPSEPVEQTNKLYHERAIPIQRHGKKRFLVAVRIKTATGSRARLEANGKENDIADDAWLRCVVLRSARGAQHDRPTQQAYNRTGKPAKVAT
jgi:hypothetical protein